jgi:hypothetical protein
VGLGESLTIDRMMDIMMMSLMNGKERELEQWKALFEQADSRFKWHGGNKPDGSRLWIIKASWSLDEFQSEYTDERVH